MNTLYRESFYLRRDKILLVAEKLLLENNQEITLNELANELNIAKGTIYKHFDSKNQLYLNIIMINEQRITKIAERYNKDIKQYLTKFMLYHMLNPNRTILLHSLEQRITNTDKSLKDLLHKIYKIREERVFWIKDNIREYLLNIQNEMSIRDFLSYIWSITYGSCLLLNSTNYQKAIGSRERLINLFINQALMTSDKVELA